MGIGAAMGTLSVAACLLVAAAGCGDEAWPGSQADGVVPFVRRPAEVPDSSVHEEVAPPDVPECGSGTVTFEIVTDEEVLGAEPGSVAIGAPANRNVALMARPGQTCGLSEWPELRFTASRGEPDAIVPEAATSSRTNRLLLGGRQRVVGIVRWNSSCSPADAEVGLEAELGDGTTVAVPLADRPPCDPAVQNTAGSWMSFPVQPPDSPIEVALVDVPDAAPFGGTLAVTVELHNPGSEAVGLDPCPVHTLTYGESETAVTGVNELNCAAAPDEIPPGGRLRFAAELDLSADQFPVGFVGSLRADVYLDAGHQPASADTTLTTA